MNKAMTVTVPAGSASARGLRAASLRSAVGVRGRIPSDTRSEAARRDSAALMDADVELVAARGRRVAALRSLMRTPERTPPEARSAA